MLPGWTPYVSGSTDLPSRPHETPGSGSWVPPPPRLLHQGQDTAILASALLLRRCCVTLLRVSPSLSLNIHIYIIRESDLSISQALSFSSFMFHDKSMLRNPTQFVISSLPFGQGQGIIYWGKGTSRAWKFF